jgi:hypothetical protein
MKRPRPHIPYAVRVSVAQRQLDARGINSMPVTALQTAAAKLRVLLGLLFGTDPVHLDHDPPLRCRKFNSRTGKYTPDANDPAFLVYRTAVDHRTKTFIRGEHGQHPDRVLIKRERRREKGLKIIFVVTTPKLRSGSKWPPKGSRPLRGRPFQRRDA